MIDPYNESANPNELMDVYVTQVNFYTKSL